VEVHEALALLSHATERTVVEEAAALVIDGAQASA
jgi:hypothetical protein